MRYFFDVAYRGTAYHGWQVQKNAIGVQQVINESLYRLLKVEIQSTGSGRTDTGVHAEQQFFHIDLEKPIDRNDFKYKMNKSLPHDILVKNIYQVKDHFHARFDAISRTYQYRIVREKDPFSHGLSFLFRPSLDLERMNQAAKLLIGEKSFQCFSRVKTDVNHFICLLSEAYWVSDGTRINFTVKANRFLRGMVRAVVGTLIDVGQGRSEVSDVGKILISNSRQRAGMSVPAHGLFLCAVSYPDGVLKPNKG